MQQLTPGILPGDRAKPMMKHFQSQRFGAFSTTGKGEKSAQPDEASTDTFEDMLERRYRGLYDATNDVTKLV
ncbi:hypothetical protein ACQ4M4_20135 [Leptolyngbya sp. AN02str]|uniref:hypothetical protein n=1 Tax=Leptolyngbya sp. AN02str TaxID=3423363 RepID=UPI003D3170A2